MNVAVYALFSEIEVELGARTTRASAKRSPPCRCTARAAVARPMPVPGKSAASWSLSNGRNRCSALAMSKPAPLSRTTK